MAENDTAIRTLDDLPPEGIVYQSDFLTDKNNDRRLIPASVATWRRREKTGDVPPTLLSFGRRANFAAHIRAIAKGEDWRKVTVPEVAPPLVLASEVAARKADKSAA